MQIEAVAWHAVVTEQQVANANTEKRTVVAHIPERYCDINVQTAGEALQDRARFCVLSRSCQSEAQQCMQSTGLSAWRSRQSRDMTSCYELHASMQHEVAKLLLHVKAPIVISAWLLTLKSCPVTTPLFSCKEPFNVHNTPNCKFEYHGPRRIGACTVMSNHLCRAAGGQVSVQSITEGKLDIASGSGSVHVGKIKATSACVITNGNLCLCRMPIRCFFVMRNHQTAAADV